MKKLYTYSVAKAKEVEESTESVNEAGEVVKTITKVKKEVPYEFAIIKPSRRLIDEADLYYNVKVSTGIQAGLLSQALLVKRFNNDGGILSEGEKEEMSEKILELVKKEKRLQTLTVKQDKNEEENAELDSLIKDVAEIREQLQDFEIRRQSLLDITAEANARTKSIVWWMYNIVYQKGADGEFAPVFTGKTFEEKQDAHDALEDEENPDKDFYGEVITKAISAIALWYYGRANKQEDFEAALAQTA